MRISDWSSDVCSSDLLRGEHRHQVVELEHEADVVAAPLRELPGAHLIDARAVDFDLAAAGRVQAADQVEQGGLARTRGTHQRDEVALVDVPVQAVQHGDLLKNGRASGRERGCPYV